MNDNLQNHQTVKIEDATKKAKPFLKWAGGKGQILGPITERVSPVLEDAGKLTYVEPFVGSGAVLFNILQQYDHKLSNVIINELNADLILGYRVLRDKAEELIGALKVLKSEYQNAATDEAKKAYYGDVREQFNKREADEHWKAAYLIFLNKTCFNGLYRVNSKNLFNVPYGKYKNPSIFDEDNLRKASGLLQDVEIMNTDFENVLNLVNQEERVLWYLDPPYRPISKSSGFNSYSKDGFGEEEQHRLKNLCDTIDRLGHHWLLSNSDPKNIDPGDDFFEELYSGYNIQRVRARRSINSNGQKRGQLFELLISNF